VKSIEGKQDFGLTIQTLKADEELDKFIQNDLLHAFGLPAKNSKN
jgi:hypothetical protein